MDPYLWIPSGKLDNEVCLRFVLSEDSDHERCALCVCVCVGQEAVGVLFIIVG